MSWQRRSRKKISILRGSEFSSLTATYPSAVATSPPSPRTRGSVTVQSTVAAGVATTGEDGAPSGVAAGAVAALPGFAAGAVAGLPGFVAGAVAALPGFAAGAVAGLPGFAAGPGLAVTVRPASANPISTPHRMAPVLPVPLVDPSAVPATAMAVRASGRSPARRRR